jgi:hypothetical protein
MEGDGPKITVIYLKIIGDSSLVRTSMPSCK